MKHDHDEGVVCWGCEIAKQMEGIVNLAEAAGVDPALIANGLFKSLAGFIATQPNGERRSFTAYVKATIEQAVTREIIENRETVN